MRSIIATGRPLRISTLQMIRMSMEHGLDTAIERQRRQSKRHLSELQISQAKRARAADGRMTIVYMSLIDRLTLRLPLRLLELLSEDTCSRNFRDRS